MDTSKGVRRLEAIRERDAQLQARCDKAGLPINEANVSHASLDRRWLLARVEEMEKALRDFPHFAATKAQSDKASAALVALNEVAP